MRWVPLEANPEIFQQVSAGGTVTKVRLLSMLAVDNLPRSEERQWRVL